MDQRGSREYIKSLETEIKELNKENKELRGEIIHLAFLNDRQHKVIEANHFRVKELSIKELEEKFCLWYRCEMANLRSKRHKYGAERNILRLYMYKYLELSQKQIGEYFHIGHDTVSRSISIAKHLIKHDPEYRNLHRNFVVSLQYDSI
jgi:hypothetical protein